MIYTSSYKNFNSSILKGVSISGDKGKGAKFYGESYTLLAPKKEFWKIWHDNINEIPKEENNKYYIEEYYKQVLKNLDPLKIYRDLDYTFLLCYEDSDEFCHRHIVAAWFELYLGFEVKEAKVKGIFKEEVSRKQYEFIKETLYNVIKDNIDMKDFSSLRALYLFNKGVELENKARNLESVHNKSSDGLYQSAVRLLNDADIEEDKYIKELKKI